MLSFGVWIVNIAIAQGDIIGDKSAELDFYENTFGSQPSTCDLLLISKINKRTVYGGRGNKFVDF